MPWAEPMLRHRPLLLKHRLPSYPVTIMAPNEVPPLRAPRPPNNCPPSKAVHPNLLRKSPMCHDTELNSSLGLKPPALKKRALLQPRGNRTLHRVPLHQSANPTTHTPAADGSHSRRTWRNWTHGSSLEAVIQSGRFVLEHLGRPAQVMSPNRATRKGYLETARRNTTSRRVDMATTITAPCPS